MVLGRILKQVRENRRFELEDVASFTNISSSRLQDFETGEREPSFHQIEKLADVYGLPSYLLASRQLPNLPESLPDFRRATPQAARLSPKGMRKIWAAEKISHFTEQLSKALNYEKPKWSKDIPEGKLTRGHAGQIREFFDEWLASRSEALDFKGTPEQSFLGGFRMFLEAQGTVVNINEAPADDFIGFYVDEAEGAPLAFINRSIDSRKAQLFTAVHEYAHYLLDEQGVSNPFVVRNDVERSCNKFAAEFLAPIVVFRRLVESQRPSVRGDSFLLIDTLSQASLLSRHATAIRLAEAEYISQPELRTWEKVFVQDRGAEKQEEKEAAGESFGPPHAKRVSELGYLPTYLAKLAVEQKMIDSIDVQFGLSLSSTLQEKAFSLATRRFEAAVGK